MITRGEAVSDRYARFCILAGIIIGVRVASSSNRYICVNSSGNCPGEATDMSYSGGGYWELVTTCRLGSRILQSNRTLWERGVSHGKRKTSRPMS